jgi:hypothetical protein
MKCPVCGSTSFRVSRFRMADIPPLLFFQYPIRCRQCRERSFAGIMFALNLRQASKARHLEEPHRQRAAPTTTDHG